MRCDAHKFAQMYEAVYIDLYRFALCMMRNKQDAEDAVSEAVLKAYENIRKLKDESAFRNWIFTITANICRRRLRESAKRKSEPIEESLTHAPSQEIDYGMSVDVKRAFFVLSEEEQAIIGLSVFGGYNSKEIGSMLGMKDNTVRSKKVRALEKMECVLK